MEPARAQPTPLATAPALGRARRAAALLADHRDELRRLARRVSLCPDDADDAVQRTAEILLRKGPAIASPELLRWSRVVVRREALAVARTRRRQLAGAGAGAVIPPEAVPSDRPDPAAALEARDRAATAAAHLGRLKRSERRALALQAAGCSYAEIQAITGWTYTKVNRCLAEGRAALREIGEPA